MSRLRYVKLLSSLSSVKPASVTSVPERLSVLSFVSVRRCFNPASVILVCVRSSLVRFLSSCSLSARHP